MAAGDEVGPLGMREELLETLRKRRSIEDLILASPHDQGRKLRSGQLLLEPFEALIGARVLIQRDPARPDPGEKAAGRVWQYGLIRALRRAGKLLAIDHRKVDAATGERPMISKKIGADQRSMHHAPRENARMEFGRRQRARPCTA